MRTELDGIRYWRHDLTGCLHITMAVLLGFHGFDPLEVLGAGWGFYYDPDELRREEYYFPCREDSLLAGVAPHHPVSSRWHAPADAAQGWRQVRAAVAAGQPVAVAADNFHLPFRPAYRDVHTNHLITVYGFDDERAQALVTDPVPPRYTGWLPIEVLTAARNSSNQVSGNRDLFFTDNPIGNRWLDIQIGQDMPGFGRDFVDAVIFRNLDAFATGVAGPRGVLRGLAGERRFLDRIASQLADGSVRAVDEGFVVAGPVLAATALHADWLARAGRMSGDGRLVEAARAVELVAHHWTAFRIAVATARDRPAEAAEPVRARGHALTDCHERALGMLQHVIQAG